MHIYLKYLATHATVVMDMHVAKKLFFMDERTRDKLWMIKLE